MGFFSKIWKGVKKVVKGIGKVFKKILKPIGKILGSSWGKALMIGLSIFTFGAALLAGAGTFASTTGSFLTKFVAGGKDFVGALIGKGAAEKGVAGVGEAAVPAATSAMPGLDAIAATGQANIAAAGELASGGAAAGGNLLSQGAQVAGAAGPTKALAAAGGQLAAPAAAAAPSFGAKAGEWIRNAAGDAKEFIKSDTGSTLVGNMLQGAAQGQSDREWIKHQQRYDRQWNDPNNPGVQQLQNFQPSETPENWPGRDQSAVVNERNSGYQPTIPFRRYQPSVGG